jgi:hypothetical protein
MALVNIEASAFLVGKESLNAKASSIIATSLISVMHVGNQKDGFFIAACPPANHIQRDFACLGKTNFM